MMHAARMHGWSKGRVEEREVKREKLLKEEKKRQKTKRQGEAQWLD